MTLKGTNRMISNSSLCLKKDSDIFIYNLSRQYRF